MKKAKLLGTLLCAACLVTGSIAPSVPVMADGMNVVTLGADLTQDQKNTMLKYFKVSADSVQIINVTNQDEREHLSAYVPIEQIGTRTVSCAYVKPTTSGGIKVRTANLNWVTCNMIATSFSTSGVKNCEVVAACPFQVSGTGALTGIQMAYESASGEQLDSTKKQIATEEMVVTGNLAEDIGQNSATAVINQAKTQIIADGIQDADQIYNIVVNIADQNGVALSDDQLQTIVSLLQEIAQQDYDYSDMEETLERVNDNVTGQGDVTADDDPDSIVNNVDESVLGDDVIADSTEDPSLAEKTGDDGFAQDTNTDASADGTTDNSADTSTDNTTDSSTDNSTDVNGDSVNSSDIPDGDEILNISEVNTDFLTDDAKALFEKAKTFGKGEYEGDAEALQEAMGSEAVCTVTLDSDQGEKLYNAVLTKYLEILGNGTGSYVPTGNEDYLTTELNMLQEDLKVIFGIDLTDDQKAEAGDKADILGDNVSSDDKNTLYKDTMKFFEQLYGETSMEETTENTDAAVPDNTDTSYDTEGTDTSMDNTDDTTMDESDMTPAEGDDMVYDETINE